MESIPWCAICGGTHWVMHCHLFSGANEKQRKKDVEIMIAHIKSRRRRDQPRMVFDRDGNMLGYEDSFGNMIEKTLDEDSWSDDETIIGFSDDTMSLFEEEVEIEVTSKVQPNRLSPTSTAQPSEPMDEIDVEDEYVPSWEDEFRDELVDLPTPSGGVFDPVGDLDELVALLTGERSWEIGEELHREEDHSLHYNYIRQDTLDAQVWGGIKEDDALGDAVEIEDTIVEVEHEHEIEDIKIEDDVDIEHEDESEGPPHLGEIEEEVETPRIPLPIKDSRRVEEEDSGSPPKDAIPQERKRRHLDRDMVRLYNICRDDPFLHYMPRVHFGPGKYKDWWAETRESFGVLMRSTVGYFPLYYRRKRLHKNTGKRIKEKPPD